MQDAQSTTSISDTDRLKFLDEGVPFTLRGGREVHFFYSLESLALIEEHFGTLSNMQERMSASEPRIADVSAFLQAGLAHEHIGVSELASSIGVDRIGDAVAAASKAMSLSTPDVDPNVPTPATATSPSTGDGSITSAPSSSTEPDLISGG